jgi:hypothetical protein
LIQDFSFLWIAERESRPDAIRPVMMVFFVPVGLDEIT